MKAYSWIAETRVWAGRGNRLALLLLLAAVLHISVALSVLAIGKLRLAPAQFDDYGIGMFAADGTIYKGEAIALCAVLENQGFSAWATWPTQLHVRLYSLPLAALYRWLGFNILAIEPLNLIYYLAILVLVFKLGETVFNYQTGIIGSGIVALWPSLLLHTTQLLRDPLLISAVLMLMLSVTLCQKRDYAWHRGILIGVTGTAAIVLIRIVRLPMWNLLVMIIGLSVLLLLVQLIRQRRFPVGNVAFVLMIIAAVIITPHFQSSFRNQQVVKTERFTVPEEMQSLSVQGQMAARRQGFDYQIEPSGESVPSEAGSDIDRGVRFRGPVDILRQVPRATLVGFFAPFPNMWLNPGKQVGSSGRLLSGFEMVLTYVIECLALFGLWRSRKHLVAWFLFLITTLGVVALGLVVTNIGALYRLRYPFWALLVVLAAGGVDYLFRRKAVATSPPLKPATAQSSGTIPS
jgi:hypothetical protein